MSRPRPTANLTGMNAIGLLLCVSCARPPGAGPLAWKQGVNRVYRPLINLLGEFESLPVNLHVPGALVEWLEEYDPDTLSRLVRLVLSRRVEIVYGPQSGSVLPAIPERDAVGQLQLALRWWRQHGDVVTRGAWLPFGGWDPSLVRMLGRMGFHYTVLDEELFSPPARLDGYHLTEREGTGLALFPGATSLVQAMLREVPERALERLVPFARDGVRCLTLHISDVQLGVGSDGASRRMISGPESWVRRFFGSLVENSHTVKLAQFSSVLDRMRSTDRVYPPAAIALPVSMAALGSHGDAWAALVEQARKGDDPSLVGVHRFLRPVPWDPILSVSPEIHRLHKRMLGVSAAVLRLRSLGREEENRGDETLAGAIADASAALFRGQDGAAYVLGLDVGAQHGAVRHEAWANLIRAEHLVRTAMGESGLTSVETVDYDVDGRPEVIVRTPWVCGVVSPATGGSLMELDAWDLPANVLNVGTRRPDAGHTAVRATERLPALVDDDLEVIDDEVEPTPQRPASWTELADRLFYDRLPRTSFVDHFLGPSSTLDNVRRGRFEEVGDFVGAEYQLLRLEEHEDDGQVVSLGRDGQVLVGDTLRLVRIVKRYVFSPESARVDVRYEVANRYHEPIRTRFAVEVGLNVNSRRDAGTYLEVDGLPVEMDVATEAEAVSEVALVGGDLGARVIVGTEQPARLWMHPIETIGRSGQALDVLHQGTAVWLVFDLEIWGQEKKRFSFSISVGA